MMLMVPPDAAKGSIGSAPMLQRKGKIHDPRPHPFKNQIHVEKMILGSMLPPIDVFFIATPTPCGLIGIFVRKRTIPAIDVVVGEQSR